MKNWERFKNWSEARQHFEKNMPPALTRMEWGIGQWMYMEHIEYESRLDFLRRCSKETNPMILTAVGTKEMKCLEKLEKKMGGGK